MADPNRVSRYKLGKKGKGKMEDLMRKAMSDLSNAGQVSKPTKVDTTDFDSLLSPVYRKIWLWTSWRSTSSSM